MGFINMGVRFLNKRRLRTVLTIVAIMLGVGILAGVNVTADSIDSAINAQIYAKLGNNDIIVRADKDVDGGWFNYADAKDIIEDDPGVDALVPRIIKSHPSYPIENSTSGWNVDTIAIDSSNSLEKLFGSCNITAALDNSFVNKSRLEDLIQQYLGVYEIPIVISKDYASRFNLNPGDNLLMYAEDPGAFSGMTSGNTSTWNKATIIGVISDTSEAVQDFMPPAKIWELAPSSKAVYMDLSTAWTYIYNAHPDQINMFFVQSSNPANVESIRDDLEAIDDGGVFPGGIFTENVKSLFTEGITQVNFLMRGIFSIFSGISLLVCAIIIKNLLEMAKEEQTHEIGIMRAVGVTKGKILLMYISQILFISIVGSVLGLIFGYYLSSLFVGSYVDTASAVGTDFSGYEIETVMSGTTILIGMSAGVLVSLIFGFFPARAAANVDPLEALRSNTEKPLKPGLIRTAERAGNFTIAAGFTAGGVTLIGSAFSGLFLFDVINPEIVALLFAGVVLLVVGIVLLGAFFFPVLVPIISTLFKPVLRKMEVITSRNLKRYSRQTKNTFAMLAIGLSMMITVGTIMNSAAEGAYPGGKTVTGGDIQVGNFYSGLIPIDPHAEGIKNLNDVAQAVPIRFSLGFEGITRVERLEDGTVFGGTADSLFGDISESFHLGILDPSEYSGLHSSDSIVKITSKDLSLNDMMDNLETPYTVLLQDRLARRMGGVEEGEIVRMRFEGFEADFEVIGIYELLPGVYWTYYSTDNTFDKQFSGIISWESYSQMIEDNIGKTDVIAKNKIEPGEEYQDLLPDEDLWGYASLPVDYQTLEDLAMQTGLVEDYTNRIQSPFWNIPSFKWETNVTLYDPNVNLSDYYASPVDEETQEELGEILNQTWALQNVLWHEDGSISSDWNSMLSRTYVIDPYTDDGYGKTEIRSTIDGIPASSNETLEDIFLWADTNLPGVNVCVVNEIYVNYNFSTGQWNYVKKFSPGERLRMYYNDSIFTDFMVIATTNSHYNYEYVDDRNNNYGDTIVFNYEAMSYNTYKYNSTDWSYYFEVMDIEPNSIFLPNKHYELPTAVTQDLIPELIDQILNNETYGQGSDNENSTYYWLSSGLESMYAINISDYIGDVQTENWNGTYTYQDNVFEFNGSVFTYEGSDVEVNFTTNIANGSEIVQGLLNGSYEISLDNLTTTVHFDLNDNMTADDIKNFITTMQEVCSKVPTLENITFFAPKLFMLEDSGIFTGYFLIGANNKQNVNDIVLELENYYTMHDLGWSDNWITRSTETEEDVGGVLGLIVNMFFGVLSFALIASLLGLSISTIISVKKRYAEIGTLRTLGFSNRQIIQMVIGEGVITAILGILVGLVAGLAIAYLIISNLPFLIFLPIVFAPPIQAILLGGLLLIAASVGVSFIPALSATKIDIADAIRTTGE